MQVKANYWKKKIGFQKGIKYAGCKKTRIKVYFKFADLKFSFWYLREGFTELYKLIIRPINLYDYGMTQKKRKK